MVDARGGFVFRLQFLEGSLLLAGALLTALAGAELSKPDPPNEYVDPHVCATCHSQIYASYRETGMGRSLFKPAPSNTVEDYKLKHTYYQTLSDTHYSMIARDGGYFQRRWQIGLDGQETNVEEMKIDYVVGAGDQARSYLHRTARDTLIELPLGWYSERGGYWAMSPGFDSRHPQTRRLISNECMFCHTGYPKLSEAARVEGQDAQFANDLPEGIDCQRCHGPGGRHIRVAQTPNATLEDFARTIVNPAKLKPQRQMEVCMQCHLEPASTRLPSIMRRFDRPAFSYIPGQPLEDFNRYFDFMPGKGRDDRFELVSAVYRLRQSRCFLASKEALTCLNCHNPHRTLPTGEGATQYYATACRKCHEPAINSLIAAGKHTASADCVSCHMPKRRTEDVVHAVITDHLIQRTPPKGDLLAERPEVHPTEAQEYHGEVVPYYPAGSAQASDSLLYVRLAQVALGNNLEQGVAALSREMNLHPPREIEFYLSLGKAWQQTGKPKEAVAAFEKAVQLQPDSSLVLQSLADALRASGDTTGSQDVLKHALHVAPLDPQNWYQSGILEAQLGQTGSALDKLTKALALDPDIPEGRFNLANLLLQTGQPEAAMASLQDALRIDPYDAAAYDLTGQILAREGKITEALYHFQKAVHLRPGYAPYLYDHALALVRAQQFDEARLEAQAATQANPAFAEAHEVLGGLFVREKQMDRARREYERVLELQPELGRAQLNLALILVSQGDVTAAAVHLRKAAGSADPNIARQATLALQRIQP